MFRRRYALLSERFSAQVARALVVAWLLLQPWL
jgi:hypothetical protein